MDLSLHHLTVMDVTAVELVRIARGVGCRYVSLFTYMPPPYRDRYPMVTKEDVGSLRTAFQETAVTPFNLEVFPLSPDADLDAMRRGLDLGAALGARHATVHSHVPDMSAAADMLAALHEVAGPLGIELGIEFNPFSEVRSAKQAVALSDAAGMGTGIVLDMLHAYRSGLRPDGVRDLRQRISYAQICDGAADIAGAALWQEALQDRPLPGTGVIPVEDYVNALLHTVVLDVEVPQKAAKKAGELAYFRARKAVEAAKSCCETRVV